MHRGGPRRLRTRGIGAGASKRHPRGSPSFTGSVPRELGSPPGRPAELRHRIDQRAVRARLALVVLPPGAKISPNDELLIFWRRRGQQFTIRAVLEAPQGRAADALADSAPSKGVHPSTSAGTVRVSLPQVSCRTIPLPDPFLFPDVDGDNAGARGFTAGKNGGSHCLPGQPFSCAAL